MGNFPKSILGIILVITFLNIVVHSQRIQYPKVKRDEQVVDDFHGTIVRDPYRWLETPDTDQVTQFVRAQNNITNNYLRDCQQRKEYEDRLNELWAYPKYGRPEKRGSRYFYFSQQRGGEVLYVQENKESVSPVKLIDPLENGVLTFPSFGVSRDGELVVYREVSTGEIPRVTGNLRVLNVSTATPLSDVIEDVRNPQIAWDKNGFFYFSHKGPNSFDKDEEESSGVKFYIYYHKIGSDSKNDVLAIDYDDFGEPDFVDMEMSVDGNYLLLRTKTYEGSSKSPKTNSIFYVVNLAKFEQSGVTEKVQLVPVVGKRNSSFVKYVTNIGQLFYFRSRIGNKNYKLIEIDMSNPAEEKWRVVIDENSHYVLQAATGVYKSMVVLSYTSQKFNSYAELRELNGSLIRMFPLEFGELLSFSGHIDDSEVLFRSAKLEGLPSLFYFNAQDPQGSMKPLVQQPKLRNYDPTNFVNEVVTFSSSDGENVEMILIHRKEFKRDGSAFALIVEREFDLDFYFRIYLSYLKDYNVVLAFPRLKEDGVGFRDSADFIFISAVEYLVQKGYSTGSKVIARGQNTFGLFVASATNRRPELFAAAILTSAAFDMLRFEATTNWTDGSESTQISENFEKTYQLSPYHNIRLPANDTLQYPAIFFPTNNEYPVHFLLKYLANLQYTLGGVSRQTNPLLMRLTIEPHDAADVRVFSKYHIDREVDIKCFLEKAVGLRIIE